MGLAIGSIGRNLQAYPPAAQRAGERSPASNQDPAAPAVNPLRTQAQTPFAEALQPEPKPPQPGFGRGTLSPPAAALEALGRGVRYVRESLPSLAERRDEIRERFDELRELQPNATGPAAEIDEPEPISPPDPAFLETAGARVRVDQTRAAESSVGLRRSEPPAEPRYVDLRA